MCQSRAGRMLMIGPLPPKIATVTNPIGGAAVNFLEMVTQLEQRDIELELVNTSRPRVNVARWRLWYSNIATALGMLGQVALRVRRCRLVFLNMSAPRAWLIGSCVWMICRFWKRPLALRFFGGDFADTFGRIGTLKRSWSDTTYMRSERVFVQTKETLGNFHDRPNVCWFPNTRDVRPPSFARSRSVRRLLFVAQLRLEKGLKEAIEACRDLPSDCHLDVYGPQMVNVNVESLLAGNSHVSYCGVLTACEVPRVLAAHDVLVLPSYWKSEGYPGIILEAFQCGIPVISTRWRGIPEVVEHGTSGMLVAPRSVPALRAAIEQLIGDPELYQKLCEGARRRGEFFRSGVWYDRMAAELRGLFGPERTDGS